MDCFNHNFVIFLNLDVFFFLILNLVDIHIIIKSKKDLYKSKIVNLNLFFLISLFLIISGSIFLFVFCLSNWNDNRNEI